MSAEAPIEALNAHEAIADLHEAEELVLKAKQALAAAKDLAGEVIRSKASEGHQCPSCDFYEYTNLDDRGNDAGKAYDPVQCSLYRGHLGSHMWIGGSGGCYWTNDDSPSDATRDHVVALVRQAVRLWLSLNPQFLRPSLYGELPGCSTYDDPEPTESWTALCERAYGTTWKEILAEQSDLLPPLDHHQPSPRRALEDIEIPFTPDGGVHCVYRHFNADDQLLWVGVSRNFRARQRGHRSTAEWWNEIARITAEQCDSEADALIAEATAIRDEHPIHNKAGRS